LVLGRDGELGPISPNEIDDLLEQMTARMEASTSKSVFPGGDVMKEKFCEETPSEAEELVDPRYQFANHRVLSYELIYWTGN